MILVTGATGTVGHHVVKELVAMGERVRALVRDPARTESIRLRGVEFIKGNLDDPATLGDALEGVDRAFLLTAFGERQVEQERSFVAAAAKAGTRHVVKLSALGARPDSPLRLGRAHAAMEKQLEESGLAWTHLRPNTFMQYLLAEASTIRERGEIRAPMKDGKVSLVDARDVALVAATVLNERGHERRIYELTGPEALTYARCAEEFSIASGRPVKYVDCPPAELRETLLASGMGAASADALVELHREMAASHAYRVTHTIAEVCEQPPRSFHQFAKDHARLLDGRRSTD